MTAMIAAAYATLTLALAPIGYGAIQFRVSEALTVLPFIFPEAIIGLFIGCLTSNIIYSPFAVLDIIFGSLATLGAAFWTSRIKNRYLAPLPPIIINALVIGFVITYSEAGKTFVDFPLTAFYVNMATVGLGQTVVCYGLGLPLLMAMKEFLKNKHNKI
ncbi:MAG TPA: transporter [Clostridiales bacterium]|nr:transporter [Clostridiales bacterium]